MRNNKLSLVMSTFVTIFFSLMFNLAPVFAKDVDVWADINYDFKNVKAFYVASVEFEINKHVKTDEFQERKINDYNQIAVKKGGYNLVQAGEQLPVNALKFTANIELWDSSEVWNEPYTSWETRYSTRVFRDADGKEFYDTVAYEVPIYHPGYYTYYSIVQVRYEIRDKDNNLVYVHKELRNRSDYNAHYKMYERITKDFFTKFKNHVKDMKKVELKAKKDAEKLVSKNN